MRNRDIIVIGASAGGLEAMRDIVRELPQDLNAALFIVRHISPSSYSVLPSLLTKAGKLAVEHAIDGEPIRSGKIYLAPPDRHMLLEAGRVRLTMGPKENRFRPAIDPLFRSAAYSFGRRVIGVILTGALDDGTAGLWAIKDRGGIAVVQDPNEAQQSSMPLSALNNVDIDYRLPVSEIARLLVRLTREPVSEGGDQPISDQLEIETRIASEDNSLDSGITALGELSAFTCPECHGALIQIKNGNALRFRCHTGHAFTTNSLLAELTDAVEDSLWNAIRSVEERVRLLKHMAQHAVDENKTELVTLLSREVDDARRRAGLLRRATMLHEEPDGREDISGEKNVPLDKAASRAL